MGQGTESCGGYEIHFDPVSEALESGKWQQRDGTLISPSKMTSSHIKNAIRHAKKMQSMCSFSCESDDWEEMIELLTDEQSYRIEKGSSISPIPNKQNKKKPSRGAKVEMTCHCGSAYKARKADIKRGWGLSCSKRCASFRREHGLPAATKVEK